MIPCIEIVNRNDPGELRFPTAIYLAKTLPLILITPQHRVFNGLASVSLRRFTAPLPRPLEQAAVWSHFLSAVDGKAHIDILANQTRLDIGDIAKVVTLAQSHASAENRRGPEHGDVVRALAEVVPEPVSPLAKTERPRVPWTHLILERKAKTHLEDIVRRLQHHVTVQDRWGMAGHENGGRGDGLVALLYGESGTGKTFAVQAMATQLCLPLITIDLSRVVSKYIGETEKHLAGLFALGEGYRAVLFFDEADALLGKRTGVSDAHDRYANIEVNFLLQRLESYDGIALLATNLQQNMDDAFTRRIGFSIHFPRPTPGYQKALWRRHLPKEHVAKAVDYDQLVERFDLVGGEIRNAALSAAYAAAARDSDITYTLIENAIREEFIKTGKPMPYSPVLDQH